MRAPLSALLCLSVALITLSEDASAEAPPQLKAERGQRPLISALEARRLIEAGQADVIDARDLKLKAWLGHIPGALHLPWRALTRGRRDGTLVDDTELIKRLDELGLSPQRELIVYAAWGGGWGEEARALWSLEYAGHPAVRVIEGGWAAWRAAGGARALGAPQARLERRDARSAEQRRALWRPRPELRVTSDEVEGLLQAGWRALDTRAAREFAGETPYGSAIGGHLPGAVHLDWARLIDGDQLLAPQALRALLAERGVDPLAPTLVYCTGGVRSAFVYLALRQLGATQVRNYDGSWWAWSERLKAREAQRGERSP